MLRIEYGVGFRLSAWGLLGSLAIMAIATDTADARRYRHARKATHHRHVTRDVYSPPYSAIVVDGNSGAVLHEANADGERHPASLTKIMTLYLLFERIESGKMKLDTEMDVSEHASSMSPTKLGLRPGQTITVDDAIRSLVTQSANDSAVVIAEAIGGDEATFARMMTKKARALGMMHTNYRNASGLPDDDQITTARDQALLGRAIQDRFPRFYRYFQTASFTYKGRTMRNHNRLLGNVNGVDGIKTGFTHDSGFNLVTSVRRGNRHLVAVVLGGRSAGARDARMRELIDEHIIRGAQVRTAPMVAEAGDPKVASDAPTARPATVAAAPAPETKRAPTRVASQAGRTDTTSTAAIPAPPVGSSDDIKPIAVKTVKVKAATLMTHTIGQQPAVQQPAPLPPQITAQPTPSPAPPAVEVQAYAPDPPQIAAQPIEPTVERSSAPQVAEQQPEAKPAASETKPVRVATADRGDVPVRATPPAPHRAIPHSGWMIQVGALESVDAANERIAHALDKARGILGRADSFTEPVTKGEKTLYRARFAGLDRDAAEAACRSLKRSEIVCITIKN